MKLVVVGLSITSSWGNGHATTFRALLSEMHNRGHEIVFLERDVPWYASHRDMPLPLFCDVHLYSDLKQLEEEHAPLVRDADVVIVGSYVPEGCVVGDWVIQNAGGLTAFYDIDTPVTLAKLERGDWEYINPELVAAYGLYLSFAGGQSLDILMDKYKSPCARPLYCSVDPNEYFPDEMEKRWDLGYLGTYSPDRQPGLQELLIKPAASLRQSAFVVAGPQYPEDIVWPENVHRIQHLPPIDHRDFYNTQRFTLNITRDDMKRLGHSPSVRLFEAAACGVPIISDIWAGLDEYFVPDKEILTCHNAGQVQEYLTQLSPKEMYRIGKAAHERVLAEHTSAHRALELEGYITEAMQRPIAGAAGRVSAT